MRPDTTLIAEWFQELPPPSPSPPPHTTPLVYYWSTKSIGNLRINNDLHYQIVTIISHSYHQLYSMTTSLSYFTISPALSNHSFYHQLYYMSTLPPSPFPCKISAPCPPTPHPPPPHTHFLIYQHYQIIAFTINYITSVHPLPL